MKKRILLILATIIAGCNSSSPAKDLFSSWAFQGSNKGILDLSGLKFGSNKYKLFISSAECDCTLDIAGTQDSGNFSIAGCVYNPGTTGGADPGCAGLSDNATYTKSADTLTVCDPNCGIYK